MFSLNKRSISTSTFAFIGTGWDLKNRGTASLSTILYNTSSLGDPSIPPTPL